MKPNEELEYFNAQLQRVRNEHSKRPTVLRISDNCLRRLSKWTWEQHGWSIDEGQACGIRNGNQEARRTGLMSVLKGHIQDIEFVTDPGTIEVVVREPAATRS